MLLANGKSITALGIWRLQIVKQDKNQMKPKRPEQINKIMRQFVAANGEMLCDDVSTF